MKVAISPKHTIDDFSDGLSVDDKIDIFIARVEGWQLDIAQSLIDKQISHRDFAILHIVVSLFEMIGKYKDGYVGKGKSRHYFKAGAKFIFQEDLDEDDEIFLKELYVNVRNGLYHIGMTSPQVIIHDRIPGSIGFQQATGQIVINPDKFVQDLRIRFRDYVSEIKDIKNERQRINFEVRFDYDNQKTIIANLPNN